jgi:uncharacterized protein (DUF2249 family)
MQMHMKKYLFKPLLIKLLLFTSICSAQLNINWANKIMSDPGSDDFCAAITGDSNGNIISVGSYKGTVDVDQSSANYYMASTGDYDIYILKYDTSGALLWAKSIGGAVPDLAYDVITDAAGNIYITGRCSALSDFDGDGDTNFVRPIGTASATVLFLAKYDSNGNYLWAKLMNGSGSGWGKRMKIDSNGDVILVGNFAGTIDFDPSSAVANVVAASTNFSDFFISKYTNNGDLIWVNKVGASVYDEVHGLTLDSLDNIYITGYMNQTVDFDPGPGVFNLTMPLNDQAGYVAKYTNQGGFVWAFLSNEEGFDLAIDAYGKLRVSAGSSTNSPNVKISQYTLAGMFESEFQLTNAGGERLFIAADSSIYIGGPQENLSLPDRQEIYLKKVTNTGVSIYEKRFGAQGGFYDDELHALYVDPTGKVFIGGFFQKTVDFDTSPTTISNFVSNVATSSFVAAYKANGDYRWVVTVEDNKINFANKVINSLHNDKDGNILIGGAFYGAISFDKFSQNTFFKSGPGAIYNSCICKYAPSGAVKWAFVYSNSNQNILYDIASDNNNNVYLTGQFSGMVDFDPSPNTFSLNSSVSSDIYIAKYDSSGNFLWAKQIGGTDEDEGHKILVRNSKIYVSGIFDGSVDFDPSASSAVMTTAQSRAFIAMYDLNGNYILARNFSGEYRSINVDNLNNIILSGSYIPTSSLIDFDFGSGTVNPISISQNSGFIAKYDSLLNYQWAVSIGSASKCILDSAQNLYLSGNTSSNTVRFYSANQTYTSVSKGNNSNFYQYTLAKYSPAGMLSWVKNTSYFSNNGNDFAYDFAMDRNSNIYLTGLFKDTVDFDFNAGTTILLPFSVTNPDAFIASYTANGDLNWVKTKQEFATQSFKSISIYDDKLYSIINTSEGYNLDFNSGGTYLIGESTYLTKYTLNCLSAPQITSVIPAAHCGNGAVTLVANASSGAPNWYSTATSSTVLFSGNSFTTPNLTSSKTYYVAVPAGVCAAARIPVTATIYVIPTILASSVFSRCDPGTGTINAQASSGVVNWYDALVGGNFLASGPSYSVPFTSVTDTFYVDATDNGCTSPTRTRQIFQIIATPSILSTTNGSGCANTPIILQATVNFGNIEWQTSTGSYLWGAPNYSVSINTTTTYYVIGTNFGCNTTPIAVTATVIPTPTFASTTPASKCDSGILTLTAAPNPIGAAINWYDQSAFGNLLSTGNSFTTPFLTNTTTYYAEISNNGCTNSTRSAITATINPLPNVSVINSGSIITALVSPANYQWINCSNNNAILGATLQSYTAISNGNYAVIITQNGCIDTSFCVNINSVGLKNNFKNPNLSFYPNPSNGKYWYTGSVDASSVFSLYNLQGQVLAENMNISNPPILDLTSLSPGFYYLIEKKSIETIRYKLLKN